MRTDLDNSNYYPALQYRPGDQLCPIPANERALQTVTAELFVEAVDHFGDLEGLHFNRDEVFSISATVRKIRLWPLTWKQKKFLRFWR